MSPSAAHHSDNTPKLAAEVVRSWHALNEGATWFSLPSINWCSFAGGKAAEVLNGLVTNDIAALSDEGVSSCYAAALTPKGKMVADMYVVRESAEQLYVAVPQEAFDGWWDIVRKYVNPRLAKYRDERETCASFLIAGPLAQATFALSGDLWSVQSISIGGVSVVAVRTNIAGNVPSWLLRVASEQSEQLGDILREQCTQGHPDALEIVRVESGRVRYGLDINDSVLAQEANMEQLGAISFEKGCYTGQETVARVHFRGRVNRYIRGLTSDKPMVLGSTITDATGKPVGEVKSSVYSPAWGYIALAMIRREVANGDTVQLQPPSEDSATEDTVTAQVTDLPFGATSPSAA